MGQEKCFIGIDPGSAGAIVAITSEGGKIYSLRFINTTEKEVWDFINGISFDYDCFALLERVGAMPGQGVVSMFTFGVSVGFIRGLLIASAIPFELMGPRTWQKGIGVTPRFIPKKGETGVEESKTDFKRRMKGIAERLFPTMKITNDLADALLIAEFCKRLKK